ncbi:Ger(x)C family spore germination protein [Fodinisporobacter ferrooxydans]|uniref:Ger(X)C family spore germination protein n=1 Tax=Fodinisporobacter ferrooxydans TaxID=2901836 RepID=A0ABY4CFG3_9BACL|nr:Ger(x)C family spore germination protein [Alicyclobacillaceae bacterium MYW30-H2]
MNRYFSKLILGKFLHIFLYFACFPLLTGCWDRKEINDLAIVLTTAIDKTEDKMTEVSVQVLLPQAVGGGLQGGGDSKKRLTIVRSATGQNFVDAMSKIQGKVPRRLFWGQCSAYIFGEQIAKGGLHNEIDPLIRHPEPRNRAYLFVSEGKAVDLLSVQTSLEGYLGKVLRKLSEEQIGVNVTLKDFQQMITGEAGGAVLPYIKTAPFKNEESVGSLLGTAIFKRDRMVGEINEKVTRGVLWLRNEVEAKSVTVKFPDGDESISMNPVLIHTVLIPKIENEKWKIKVRIEAEGKIVQNATHLDIMNPDVNKIIQKKFSKVIKNRINQALDQVQKRMKTDVFRFAETFERKYPGKWDHVKDRWDEIFPRVEVSFDLKTYVRGLGLTTRSAGLPEREVRKK